MNNEVDHIRGNKHRNRYIKRVVIIREFFGEKIQSNKNGIPTDQGGHSEEEESGFAEKRDSRVVKRSFCIFHVRYRDLKC